MSGGVLARLRGSDLVRHGTLVLAASVLANALQYAYYATIARVAGVESYGVVTALFSASLIVAAPALVVATVVAKLAADLHVLRAMDRLRRLSDVVTATTLAAGSLLCLAAVLARSPLAAFFHLSEPSAVLMTAVLLIFTLALPAQRAVLQGAQRFRAFSISNVLEGVVKFAFGAPLAALYGSTGALGAIALAYAAAAAYNTGTLRTAFAQAPASLRMDLRAFLGASRVAAAATLSVAALTLYDPVVVRHAFSPQDAGLYGAAVLVGRAVYVSITFASVLVLPKAAARAAAGTSTRPLLAVALGGGGAVIAVALLACAVAPRTVVVLLSGAAFAPAAPLVLPYAAALSFLALANVVTMYNIGVGRSRFVLPLAAVAAAEILTVALWHPSLRAVLACVLCGHAGALLATCFEVLRPRAAWDFVRAVAWRTSARTPEDSARREDSV